MWPFKKKKTLPNKLVFKDSEAFFDMQCKYGETDIVPKKGLVALVLDARKEIGASEAVKTDADGRKTAMLKVASDDGGFLVVAKTARPGGDALVPGDLVIWVPVDYAKMNAEIDGDPRFFWVGFIVLKIDKEMDVSGGGFRHLCRYD